MILARLLFIAIFSTFSMLACPMHDYAEQWYKNSFLPLSVDEQKMMANFVQTYERAAHFDIKMRKDLITLQSLHAQLTHDNQANTREILVKMTALIQWLNDYFFKQYEQSHEAFRIEQNNMQSIQSPLMQEAIAQLQLIGQQLIVSAIMDRRNQLHDESIDAANMLKALHKNSLSYGVVFNSFFCFDENAVHDFDAMLQLNNQIENDLEMTRQSLFAFKLITLELETILHTFLKCIDEKCAAHLE